MRITILPLVGCHTNQGPQGAVSMMAKGSIVTSELPLRCFLFLLPNYMHVYAIIMHYSLHFDKREVLQQEYSQPPILPSPHFRWVVKVQLPYVPAGLLFHAIDVTPTDLSLA